MKSVPAALQALFGSTTQFMMADLYTITLVQGPVLYYTSADVSLTVKGNTYTCLGPKIQRSQVKTILGVQVDSLDINFYPELTDLALGQPLYQQFINGVFDGAWVSLDRAFLTSWTSAGVVGTVNMFQGKVAGTTVGRTNIKTTVKSPLELTNINLPRNTFQQGCQHNLFDAGCKLSRAAFTFTGHCVGAQGTFALTLSTVINDPTYLVLGFIQFTSGQLNGLWRTITAQNSSGGIQVMYPFPVAPLNGDTYFMLPGCDHQLTTCTNKFNNRVHFRGFPFVPQPTTAV